MAGLESLNFIMTSHEQHTRELVVRRVEEFLMLTLNPDVNEKITIKLINTLQTITFKFPDLMVNYLDNYF